MLSHTFLSSFYTLWRSRFLKFSFTLPSISIGISVILARTLQSCSDFWEELGTLLSTHICCEDQDRRREWGVGSLKKGWRFVLAMLERMNENFRKLHHQCVMNEGLYLQVTTYFLNQVIFIYCDDREK